jgi:hypothetical protein
MLHTIGNREEEKAVLRHILWLRGYYNPYPYPRPVKILTSKDFDVNAIHINPNAGAK